MRNPDPDRLSSYNTTADMPELLRFKISPRWDLKSNPDLDFLTMAKQSLGESVCKTSAAYCNFQRVSETGKMVQWAKCLLCKMRIRALRPRTRIISWA